MPKGSRKNRKTRAAIEVDVQDGAVECAFAGHLHGAFQPADRADRLEAALAQKFCHDIGYQQVVVTDEYPAPVPRTTVALHWLTPPPTRAWRIAETPCARPLFATSISCSPKRTALSNLCKMAAPRMVFGEKTAFRLQEGRH
ncbi:hypothetical protein [Reyranella soli]|uniref:Uncharacterized protein n=1 Tax=Reyranella soli TaxID=1230389 RepID=A0A512NSH7_9HYPH|nr:hypothetical protein [Reyranella soli]GEP61894.1 hypothetical protein RSO01_90600 [Reyranella soli]